MHCENDGGTEPYAVSGVNGDGDDDDVDFSGQLISYAMVAWDTQCFVRLYDYDSLSADDVLGIARFSVRDAPKQYTAYMGNALVFKGAGLKTTGSLELSIEFTPGPRFVQGYMDIHVIRAVIDARSGEDPDPFVTVTLDRSLRRPTDLEPAEYRCGLYPDEYTTNHPYQGGCGYTTQRTDEFAPWFGQNFVLPHESGYAYMGESIFINLRDGDWLDDSDDMGKAWIKVPRPDKPMCNEAIPVVGPDGSGTIYVNVDFSCRHCPTCAFPDYCDPSKYRHC